MLRVHETGGAVTLAIKVHPCGCRDAIVGEHGGALKVVVTAAPEKGKANSAILKLLAKSLGFRNADVTFLRGEASSEKLVRFNGVNCNELLARLEAHLS